MAQKQVPNTGIIPKKGVIPEPNSGVRLNSSTVTPADPKLWHRNEEGGRLGFSHKWDEEVVIDIVGEIFDETGTFPELKHGQAITLANEAMGRYAQDEGLANDDVSYNGVGDDLPAGNKMDFYFDSPPVYGATRGGWRSFRARFMGVPLMNSVIPP